MNKNKTADHPIETLRPFTQGDLVTLKSGGQTMTFREYTATGDAYVMYSAPSGLQHATLPVAMLQPARVETQPGTTN